MVEIVLDPTDTLYHTAEYATSLKQLESSIEALNTSSTGKNSTSELNLDMELYRLAALAYLERGSTNFSGPSAKLNRWIDYAFKIMATMETGHQPFIIFIFGCEARSDERRIFILDLFQKAESVKRRNLNVVHRMVQAVWLQDDLGTGHEVNYLAKLRAVFSSMDIVPSLA